MVEQLYEGPAWIYKMFMTFIVAVVAIGIVGTTLVTDINTREVQKSLLLSRILYSPDGFWYTDTNGVMMPGVVDYTKFTPDRMNANFNYPENYGGVHITLDSGGNSKDVYINTVTFNNFKTQFQMGLLDRGSFETHHYPVLVKYSDREVNGWLTVEIAMPQAS